MTTATRKVKKEIPAHEARAEAQRIAFGPVLFMACWTMQRKGLFDLLFKAGTEGITQMELAAESGLSPYAIKVLADMALTSGVLHEREGRLTLTNTGLMLATDKMTQANMDFVGDVCYQGMWHLEEALEAGRPAGLKVFGEWPTVYRALAELPQHVRRSWFEFDHFYSDHSFPPAMDIVFASAPRQIMDVGGNTGKWAISCLRRDPKVRMTVVDLPGQLVEVERNVAKAGFADRLTTVTADMLDPNSRLPEGADIIWMSQFLDCFSEDEVVAILQKARSAMGPNTSVYIMETFIDRQRFEAASFCLAGTSLYFTAIANGNSRMYRAEDFKPLVERAGLRVAEEHDHVGQGHSIWRCVRA
ncbi:MAG: methyltransferase domain-containing protein [Flavobacteriales bacterium]|nr:methyltransferase domain-containing protein [Flavobacteriales bacterium]